MSKWPCGRREQLGVVWDFPEKPKSKATSTERNRHRKGHLWRSPVARVVRPEITRSQAPNAAMRCQAASNPAHGSGAAPIRRTKRRRHRQRNTGAENHRRSAPLRSIAARCIEMSPSPMADENRFVLCWMCLKSASQKPRQTNAADIESDTIGDHQRRRRAGCPRPSPVTRSRTRRYGTKPLQTLQFEVASLAIRHRSSVDPATTCAVECRSAMRSRAA